MFVSSLDADVDEPGAFEQEAELRREMPPLPEIALLDVDHLPVAEDLVPHVTDDQPIVGIHPLEGRGPAVRGAVLEDVGS